MLQSLPPATETHWWTIFIPTDPVSVWTMALALGTVGVAIAAWRALRSLKLTRTEMVNRATREAAQCAIDRCDEMARELLPLHMEILTKLGEKKLGLFVTQPSQVSFEEKEEAKKINSAIAWMGKLDSDLISLTVRHMNALECWSMGFTHDPALASEAVAFEPCSTVFCQMVMTLYPGLLTQRRANPASGPYQNLVTLFKGWYAKKTQGPMLEQLTRLQSDGAKLPPPMGTGLDR